jgi:hypothetical protein
MKKVLKLSALIAILFFVSSCQKNLNFENEQKGFNPAFVKEWYYGKFKKSAEWLSSNEHGKKLPDWNTGNYRKVGNIEIVDFRLGQEKRRVPITSDTSISVADKKRIAESSFTRILFIKTGDKIEVRELQFVPEIAYLKQKNYDLSEVRLGDGKNDFTGRIITRKWNGEILSTRGLVNGKIKTVIKPIEKKNENKKNSETLRTIQFCDEKTTCIWVITCTKTKTISEDFCYWGGGGTSNTVCLEAEVTEDCTSTQECTLIEVDDDPNDPNDLVPSCEYNANQGCECQLLSIGCVNYQGGGNNDPGGNPFIINYQLTPTDIQIINELDAEDAESDNILLNMECKGTKRTGNINFNGTLEHWLIQLDFIQKDIIWRDREYAIPQSSSYNNNNKGYADMVDLLTNEIFEIKNKLTGIPNGINEVANYVTKANAFCPVALGSVGGVWHQGVTYPKTYLPYKIANLTLVAELVAPGVVGYSFENNTSLNPQPYPIIIPQDILAQLKELVERLRTYTSTFNETIAEYLHEHPGLVTYLKSQLVVAAVAIVVGTLVEDILTGGVGVLDDFASFALAYRIVRFAWKIP